MTFPPARVPQIDPRELRPRRFWYAIALGIALTGVLAGLGLFVTGMLSIGRNLPELHQRFRPGERVTVELAAGERTMIYGRKPGSNAGCQAVESSSGVNVAPPPYSFEFTADGATWYALYEVHTSRGGAYTLTCGGAGPVYALGELPEIRGFFVSLFGSIIAFVAFPLLGVGTGGTIGLVVAVSRYNNRKRTQAKRQRDPSR